MDDLECINLPQKENYYDKADWEEDECLGEIPLEVMRKYEKLEKDFDKLCEGVEISEAAKISSNEREEKNIQSNDFIYGEIGSGRAVIAASLCHEFDECIGIELLDNLHKLSLKILDNIEKHKETSNLLCPQIRYFLDDITTHEYDYERSSLVFINCKTFSLDLMKKIAKKLEPMPEGVIMITSFQILPDENNWEVVSKLRRLMSWGCANLYIQIKKK